jgi:hypothetical protein
VSYSEEQTTDKDGREVMTAQVAVSIAGSQRCGEVELRLEGGWQYDVKDADGFGEKVSDEAEDLARDIQDEVDVEYQGELTELHSCAHRQLHA